MTKEEIEKKFVEGYSANPDIICTPGALWDSELISKSKGKEFKEFDFFINTGILSAKTYTETNMIAPGRLCQGEAFLVQWVAIDFELGCELADRASVLNNSSLWLYVSGKERYGCQPLAIRPLTFPIAIDTDARMQARMQLSPKAATAGSFRVWISLHGIYAKNMSMHTPSRALAETQQ